jgi:GNAT superfamily N-acetyltransferase
VTDKPFADGWSIGPDDPLSNRVAPLLEESEQALRAQYRDEHIFTASAAELAAPGCVFLTATRKGPPPARLEATDRVAGRAPSAGAPMGCIGLVPTGPNLAEIKRLYVTPTARRQGLARALVEALEESARHAGVTCLQLETGRAQGAAIVLYEAMGYRPIPAFGAYVESPESLCYEKDLTVMESS